MRKLLAPFAGIWWIITQTRNVFYNVGVFPSSKFKEAIIVVGNLSVGGTGKSPHTMYILEILRKQFKVASLSRGYGRETSGFIIANYNSNAQQIGDEPMQFFNRFKNSIVVSVGESRVQAIRKLLKQFKLDAIILDDAFQHRKLNVNFNILLTPYNNLYVDDYVLPMGNLRESKINAKRANIIIVTKCPKNITEEEKQSINSRLKIKDYQDLFFSKVVYSPDLHHAVAPMSIVEAKSYNVILITGIANETPFVKFSESQFNEVHHFNYPDHYNYKEEDVEQLNLAFEELSSPKLMLTTEKDYMRLRRENALIENLYYLPISIDIDKSNYFNQIIIDYVTENSRSN